jgi:hypothetical protein
MNDVLISRGRDACRFAGLPRISSLVFVACLVAVTAALGPFSALAVPYATCLTNSAGTISFRLNESADRVKIVSDGGATTTDLGALPAGLQTIALSVSGTFQVVVSKASPAGFATPVAQNRGAILQISQDSDSTRFNNPRGIAVNTDPASPYFGRVYVSNSTVTNTPRAGDGIYVLNADLTDAVGQGNTALTGGLDFTTGTAASPYRLSIGADNNLYVCDWSDSTGSLYVTDPDVGAGSGRNVLGGPTGSPFPVTASRIHGSIAAAVVEGSLGAGNLVVYVIDEDLQNDRVSTTQNMRNSLWRHDIGGSLPGPEVLPTRVGTATPWINFASQTMDLSRGTNGYFYVNDYRSVGGDRGGVYVLDASGAELWNSLAASRALLGDGAANDLLRATGGGAVAPRGDFLAVINIETNGITVVPLTDGIPDLANRLALNGFNTVSGQGREVAFDLAGNLYAASSAAGLLRVFSPGGSTTATTGSDGTFRLIRPPGVSAVATDAVGSETGPDTMTFTLTRDGDPSSDLTVSYTLTGSAVNGTDYQTDALSATIPAGFSSVDVVITPIDDAEAEPVESVTLTVVASALYDAKIPVIATAAIVDNELPRINISVVESNAYERFPQDTLTFRIDRLGETNSEVFVFYDTLAGTAVAEVDFSGAGGPLFPFLILAPGQLSQTITLVPIDDSEVEGNETVGLTILPDASYTVGTPDTAFAVITDDELPPAAVLFSDDFDSDSSANWTLRFGANNDIYDAEVKWAFDYGTLGIPASPHSLGTSNGVFLQVNRTNSAANGAAAVNLYPNGRTFSGNFALRADMYLSYDISPAGSTEHALLGLNHSGLLTNRFTLTTGNPAGSSVGGDGVWAAIGTDASNSRDWAAYFATNANTLPGLYTNRSAASVAALLSAPPYALAGSPGNRSASGTKTWAEMELSQINNVITLKVNNSVVYSFANPSGFTSGDIMIGHNDSADSIGSVNNFVIFDNVRVVTFDTRITSVQLLDGNQVQIDFIAPGQASDFHLESTPGFSPASWNEENAAVISAQPTGFRAVVARNGDARFYRIRR